MSSTSEGRIPASLRAIFLSSNKGEEVHAPPKDRTASKVFRRNRNGHGGAILSKPQYARFQTPNFGSISPQALLHLKLKTQGYNLKNYSSRRSGYYNVPTEHQLASYGSALLDVIKKNQPDQLRKFMESGLSPNACNASGESILHMVCRHGKADLFRVLLAFDVDLQQTDDYGRSAMHDACWAATPSFEIAFALLKRDSNLLFLYDARGSLPLSYVTKANWAMWRDFLEETLHEIFPRHNTQKDKVPFLCTIKPNLRPVPDPKHKIDPTLASMVASGALSPYEALVAMNEEDDDDETTVACSTVDDSDSSYYSSDSDFDSDEEDELYEIAGGVTKMKLGTIDE